jgi:hypothetical protein
VFPLFVFLYALVVVVGAVSNVAVIRTVIKHPTYGYIVNLATADNIKCVLVLPVSLTVLLVQNGCWADSCASSYQCCR